MRAPDPLPPGVHTLAARQGQEGEGAEVFRLFPVPGSRWNLDPFVLFDHFRIGPGSGFPTHPHRGFEAITYLLEGGIRHRDSLGNDSTMGAGGAQRFTAGRGLEHSEMPAGESAGIQLWINLPRAQKSIEPDYQAVPPEDLPVRPFAGGERRIVVGEGSPLRLHTPVHYEILRLEPGAAVTMAVPPGWQGLAYVLEGGILLGGRPLAAREAGLFAGRERLELAAGEQAAEVVWLAGRPHGEPLRQHGPFVD